MIDRRGNPILTYGLLELGIGLFAFVFPLLLKGLTPLYRSIYPGLEGRFYLLSLIRFLLSFLLVLIPSTLMGGTLPVLGRYVSRSLSNLTFRIGWLYSINTFGAVVGTFGTGFLLLPALGMRWTIYVAVLANVAIFVISLLLARSAVSVERGKAVETRPPEDRPSAPTARTPAGRPGYERIVLVAFLFTGMAALSAEVIWTRVLTLVVGTTVYAFTTMLTTFLLGLAVGSAVFARIAQRTSKPRTLFGLLVLAIGFVVFASTVAFGRLPVLYMNLYESTARTWGNLTAIKFLLSFGLMIVPTFLMGGTFPLVARIYAVDLSKVGSRIGTAYAFNTVGSIIGSFLGSFVLLRLLGVENGMITVSLIYLAVGLVLFLAVSEWMRRALRYVGALAVAGIVVVMVLFSPGWDRQLMTSAVYVYAPIYRTTEGLKNALERRAILYYDEGPGATVSVERYQNILSIRIDGKIDASSGADMITQELISHLPLLFHPEPDTVLLIGLGSGVSLGSAETHDIEYIECVELLENVIEAARYYKNLTHNCLSDPRLKLIVGDGRNHVLLTDQLYDVIISQPTNPWISGVGDLFTLEFFTEARKRLKPAGIMCAWFQTYHMGEPELRSTLRTFVSVFPHASLWFSNESDLILIGSLTPVSIDRSIADRMSEPSVRDDLDRVSIDEVSDILSALVLNESDLKAFAGPGERIHTDDNMLVEFQAGRRVGESTHIIHLSKFLEGFKPNRFDDFSEEVNERTRNQVEAKRLTMRGTIERVTGKPDQARALYDRAFALAPGDPYVVTKYAEQHLTLADALLVKGRLEEAESEYEKALADTRWLDSWIAYDGLGLIYLSQGRLHEARSNFAAAVRVNPYHGDGYFNLGATLSALGDTLLALRSYEKAHELMPDDLDVANTLAWLYAEQGEKLDRALELARLTTEREQNANYFDTLGWVYFTMEDFESARASLEQALSLDPQNAESMYHLAVVHRHMGNRTRAEELLREVIGLDRGAFAEKAEAMLNDITSE
jgi:spermidine synthase